MTRRKRRKLILAVIDGVKPAMLERAVEQGRAPTLELLIERGSYVHDAVAVFPSVTPVCAASIVTGAGPDRHMIPSMNWYHRGEARYVEYGSSFTASRRFGIAQQLTDTVYNMNRVHLSADTPTVFERLDDAQVRTAGTTYLMYRGRHRHEASRETALARFASRVLIRHPVMGPRELFYADVFASRDTGCRGQLGMPGIRDRHSGCVGAYLVEHDLFDFMLLSLPDNDSHSHRNGPHAQVASLEQADRQLARIVAAAGGEKRFLDDHAVIVVADHSHTTVERAIDLADEFADLAVLQPGDSRPEDADIALCPAQRAAMVYLFDPALRERVVARARAIPGVDIVMWREGAEAVLAGASGELRVAPGGEIHDEAGRGWSVRGELEVIDARIADGVLRSENYPDALTRAWEALACPTAGEVMLSASPSYEFLDWGGQHHVGGGSHGSLHACDSRAPLICCGTELGERAVWSIKDVAPIVWRHFGLEP